MPGQLPVGHPGCTRSLAAITGDECPYGPWHCAEALGVGSLQRYPLFGVE